MTPGQEARLTLILLFVCLALAALNLAPRLSVGRSPISHEQPDVTVAISGAVRTPGVYSLPWGARVDELVSAAGGYAAGAEPSLVNLAAQLVTGETVFVPEVSTPVGEVRVSLNSASPEQLESLPGVGPVTARRIVAGRPYARLEELVRVKGIGPKTLERLRPHVRL